MVYSGLAFRSRLHASSIICTHTHTPTQRHEITTLMMRYAYACVFVLSFGFDTIHSFVITLVLLAVIMTSFACTVCIQDARIRDTSPLCMMRFGDEYIVVAKHGTGMSFRDAVKLYYLAQLHGILGRPAVELNHPDLGQ